MSGTKSISKEAVLAEQLAEGTQKHIGATTPVLVAGGTFTSVQIVAQLNSLTALRAAVDSAKSALRARLADERSKAPTLVAFLQAYEGFVRSAFGTQPDVLADFGLAPRKIKTPPTVEQKAAAKAKRAATRAARGTIGKKKKLAIHGNVTGVLVTPVTQPATAQPLPTPPTAAATNGAAPPPH
jgi:hypothetical protein